MGFINFFWGVNPQKYQRINNSRLEVLFLILIRFCCSLLILGAWILELIVGVGNAGAKAYVFLTTWGVHLTCLSIVLVFVSSIIEHNSTRFRGERYFWRLTWVLFEIMLPTNILITFVFWVFLFPEISEEYLKGI